MKQRRPFGFEIVAFVRDIKLEHSLFALPFALLGMLMGSAWQAERGLRERPWPNWLELILILIAMIGMRTAAMGFNRLVDRGIDARNPRTRARPLAAGQVGRGVYIGFVLIGVGALVFAAAQLNELALRLVPLALLVTLGYSLTKRFTLLCHWFVGLALGIAPLGAWVAVTGLLPPMLGPYALAGAVMLWVGGFDILYATLDVEFDRGAGIRSLPARFGIGPALHAARASHAAMVALLVATIAGDAGLGASFGVGVLVTAGLLLWQHLLVRPDDLRRVNTAFFTLNAVVGLVLLAAGMVDLLR